MQKARLLTGPILRLVEPAVLPSYEWCVPRWLDVLLPDAGLERAAKITSDNPPRMVFVIAPGAAVALPAESGALHLPGLPHDAQVLAPWAIDDATDAFFESGVAPEEVLTLATDSLRGVFWGLHDWAHFHSHGPFERVAETELQCDVAALSWLAQNRAALGAGELEGVLADVTALWRERFAAERRAFELEPALRVVRDALRCAPPPGVRA